MDTLKAFSVILPVTGWKQVPSGAFLVPQSVKKLPVVEETQVQSLGQKDLPKKEMVTHSSSLAWRMPWREKPGRLQSIGLQRVGHD